MGWGGGDGSGKWAPGGSGSLSNGWWLTRGDESWLWDWIAQHQRRGERKPYGEHMRW